MTATTAIRERKNEMTRKRNPRLVSWVARMFIQTPDICQRELPLASAGSYTWGRGKRPQSGLAEVTNQ